MEDKKRIFLWYMPPYRHLADALYVLLEKDGFFPWMDTRDITIGLDWEEPVRRAFAQASYFIAIKRTSVDEEGIRNLFADLYPSDPTVMKVTQPEKATMLCLTGPQTRTVSNPHVVLEEAQEIAGVYASIKAILEKALAETPASVSPVVHVKNGGIPLEVSCSPASASIFLGNRYLGSSPQTIDVGQLPEEPYLFFFEWDHKIRSIDLSQPVEPEELHQIQLEPLVDKEPSGLSMLPDQFAPMLVADGMQRFFVQEYEAALGNCQQAFLLEPRWFGAFQLSAIVNIAQRLFDWARARLEMVHYLEPGSYLPFYYLAVCDVWSENMEAAMEHLEALLENPCLAQNYRESKITARHALIDRDPYFEPIRKDPHFGPVFSGICSRFLALLEAPAVKVETQKRPPKGLPFSVKGFHIRAFQCIDHTFYYRIPDNCPWIFLTGNNGDGKSSILQAIALGAHGLKRIRLLKDMVKIGVFLQKNGIPLRRKLPSISAIDSFLGYGPARLQMQGELSKRAEAAEATNPVSSLLQGKGHLRNIEHWLKEQKLKEGSSQNPQDIARRAQDAIDTIVALMPNIQSMALEGDKVFYREKGRKVPVEHLSAGHTNIVAMVGDMLIRLFEAQPEVKIVADLEGIVLIDELENHLHPNWQYQLPGLLSKTFPKVQFIASTHSPIPLMGAPEHSLFLRVERDEKKGTTVEKLDVDVANLRPNSLYSSPLFGFDFVTSLSNRDLTRVHTEDEYSLIEKNEERDRYLEKAPKESIPDDFFDVKE